jgi:polyhydroxyalkanoate synthesis regulator phasin
MADKDDKPPASRSDAVRGAAVQAFQATAGQAGVTRERAQELADELASAAGRVIGALDDLRPATGDDIRALREDLRALEGRVAALETPAARPAPKRAAKSKPTPKPKPKPKA